MTDALVKVRHKDKDKDEQNLGIWTFQELPRIGETLMLGIQGTGYYGYRVVDVCHVPKRFTVDTASICIFVDYGANQNVRNQPPAPHHRCGMVQKPNQIDTSGDL